LEVKEALVFFTDRLYDDYEFHQRHYSRRDELDVWVGNATVSRPGWYHKIMAQVGDGLIAAGRPIKKYSGVAEAPTFFPQAR
jgi:hypothetical protein